MIREAWGCRSSALASKATGFPIAKMATKLAMGMTLDQIPNDITQCAPPPLMHATAAMLCACIVRIVAAWRIPRVLFLDLALRKSVPYGP